MTVLSLATSAEAASGPKLTVPKGDLEAALECPIDPADAERTPVLLIFGTAGFGDEVYGFTQAAWDLYGHPVCYLNLPDFATGDIQASVEYVVHGLRSEFKSAGRKVAVLGHSQGGLLARFALT